MNYLTISLSWLIYPALLGIYFCGLALPDDDVPLRDGGQGVRAYGEAVSIYLGLGASKLSESNSTICTWMSGVKYEVVRSTFSRQAIPMTWDFAESNPFAASSGDYYQQISRMANVLTMGLSQASNLGGTATQQDAAQLESYRNIAISTDPPYYDNIGYADLSDYFYVWLRQSLRSVIPGIFSTLLVPKGPELVATPFRYGGDKDEANLHFETGLYNCFEHFNKIAASDYPVTVYYAFKQTESNMIDSNKTEASTGWEKMLTSLIRAGFCLNGTWPIRTERSVRTVASGTNALASSIVLVCRPRPDDAPTISRRDFVSLLRRELPAALREMQSGNIAPVDLAQAAIGPGMAVYSRYTQVLEANGDPLTVRAALQLINQELDAYLSEQEGDVDSDTRFAIAWFDQTGFEESDFGLADVLARAKNTSVEGIVQAGLAIAGRGKVRLRHWEDADWPPGWDPTVDSRITVWEATHHLIYRLTKHGEGGAARLLLKLDGEIASEARQLAYRLYSICERKGWADHARAYNALVISWPAIQEEVTRLQQELAAGAPTEQARLF